MHPISEIVPPSKGFHSSPVHPSGKASMLMKVWVKDARNDTDGAKPKYTEADYSLYRLYAINLKFIVDEVSFGQVLHRFG
jgi:hypothetical protein